MILSQNKFEEERKKLINELKTEKDRCIKENESLKKEEEKISQEKEEIEGRLSFIASHSPSYDSDLPHKINFLISILIHQRIKQKLLIPDSMEKLEEYYNAIRDHMFDRLEQSQNITKEVIIASIDQKIDELLNPSEKRV